MRFFEPDDRLVGARLQQVHLPDLTVEITTMRFTGAEPHGSFDKRDRLLDGPGKELALADTEECHYPVGIERKHRLVCGNGLRMSALSAQHLAFRIMHVTAAGRRARGLRGQAFSARDISLGRVGHIIEHTASERVRQPALSLDGSGIDRQCTLEQANLFRKAVA